MAYYEPSWVTARLAQMRDQMDPEIQEGFGALPESADAGILETQHLLASRANASRLLASIQEADAVAKPAKRMDDFTLDDYRRAIRNMQPKWVKHAY